MLDGPEINLIYQLCCIVVYQLEYSSWGSFNWSLFGRVDIRAKSTAHLSAIAESPDKTLSTVSVFSSSFSMYLTNSSFHNHMQSCFKKAFLRQLIYPSLSELNPSRATFSIFLYISMHSLDQLSNMYGSCSVA